MQTVLSRSANKAAFAAGKAQKAARPSIAVRASAPDAVVDPKGDGYECELQARLQAAAGPERLRYSRLIVVEMLTACFSEAWGIQL